jgi:hypothetical protein
MTVRGSACKHLRLPQPGLKSLEWCIEKRPHLNHNASRDEQRVERIVVAALQARGELLSYEQWNLDENSVVSFAGMGFRK